MKSEFRNTLPSKTTEELKALKVELEKQQENLKAEYIRQELCRRAPTRSGGNRGLALMAMALTLESFCGDKFIGRQ